MREAWSQFYEAVNAQALAHAGDPILTTHVLNAAAHVDPAGHWKIRKVKQSHKIDGLVASVMPTAVPPGRWPSGSPCSRGCRSAAGRDRRTGRAWRLGIVGFSELNVARCSHERRWT
jgi:hypothetical protein